MADANADDEYENLPKIIAFDLDVHPSQCFAHYCFVRTQYGLLKCGSAQVRRGTNRKMGKFTLKQVTVK